MQVTKEDVEQELQTIIDNNSNILGFQSLEAYDNLVKFRQDISEVLTMCRIAIKKGHVLEKAINTLNQIGVLREMPFSIQKVSSEYLDGNLSREEVYDVFTQIQHNYEIVFERIGISGKSGYSSMIH